MELSELMQPVPRGAATEQIAVLPTRKFVKKPTSQSESPEQCGICLSEYETGETIKTLPKCLHAVGHIFYY